MKKRKTNTKSQTRSLIHQNRKIRNLISPSMHSVSLCTEEEWGQAEEALQGTHTLLHLCGAKAYGQFYGYRSIVFEQLHRGRNSEHVHPCTQACTKHRSAKQHTQIYADGHTRTHTCAHTQFIHWLGHQIYALFPGRKTLLRYRHSSLGFQSAIWCLAKASFVTDCVLKRLYDQNLCGAEEFKFLCGKKDCGGVCCLYISVCVHVCVHLCAQTSAQHKRYSECWTSTGGEHTLAQDPTVKHWLRGRQSE